MKKEELKKKYDSHPVLSHNRTVGQRAADGISKIVGSWIFITITLIILVSWVSLNSYFLFKYSSEGPFDPYPFIFLNLVLSCLSAIQAPIILMSQNRQTHRDRLMAEYDYNINKKAEKEIREIKELILKLNKK